MRTVVVALLVALAAWGGYQVFQTLRGLQSEVGTLGSRVVGLEGDLEQAQQDTQKAIERAEQADQVALFMEERAEAAETNADSAHQNAAHERTRAEAALAAAERATVEADEAISSAAEAQEARLEAEQERMAAQRKAEEMELEAWRAQRAAEALEKQRARDLDRLESALGRLANTRRTALGVVMNLGDSIEFDFNGADLRPEARELLSRIAGVLLTAEDFGIQVYGHTDDVGSEEYNLDLSERRAAAVRSYLLEAGIRPDLIAMKGFGKGAPLAEGTDEASRQKNRRVEIAVVQIEADDYVPIESDSRR